jgi:hypothetical protein
VFGFSGALSRVDRPAVDLLICARSTIGNATATKNKIEDVIGSKTEPIAKGTNLYSNEVVRTGDASCMRLRQLQSYAT